MFDNYTKLVLLDYERKRRNNELSLLWVKPTTAKIKEECLAVCTRRFSRRDGKVLEAFFKEGNDKVAVLKGIEKCHPDDFRPLLNYLRKKTEGTAEKNIELLAWLIDFERRPYKLGEVYEEEERDSENDSGAGPIGPKPPQDGPAPIENGPEDDLEDKPTVTGISEPGKEDGTNQGGENPPENPLVEDPVPEPEAFRLSPTQSKRRTKYLVPFAVLAFLLLAGAFVFNKLKNKDANSTTLGAPGLTSSESCMYWVKDHYQQIPCNQKVQGAEVVPLNAEKLQHFKKINCPETIKKSEIEKYWYCKLKTGEVEFYTADGFHPVDTKRRLKPLTEYMYEKYITNRTPCP